MKSVIINEKVFAEVVKEIATVAGFAARDPKSRLQRREIQHVGQGLADGGTLLDIGCGMGFVPRYFHKLGCKVISVDYPVAGGMAALQDLMDRGIVGHYTQVGLEPLPIPDSSVDVAFAGNVIEHLPNSPKFFLNDLKRVLRPNGYMVIDTKNAVDLKTRAKLLMGVSNWTPLSTYFDLEINPHHHKEYTLSELEDAIRRTGLVDVQGYAVECFFQLSLKKFKGFQALGKDKSQVSQFGGGFDFFNPYEYFRVLCLGLTTIFPELRSDIMAVGRK